MSYMTFAVGTLDADKIVSSTPLVKSKFSALGATRVANSVVLTGEGAGSTIVTCSWDSMDISIAARAAFYQDAECQAMFAAGNWNPTNYGVAQLLAERGNGEGAYSVAVAAVSEVHAADMSEVLSDIIWPVASKHGVNGYRSLRMIAAGEQTGGYLNIFYTDSVDAYLASSAEMATNSDFLGFNANNGARIVGRQINRTVS